MSRWRNIFLMVLAIVAICAELSAQRRDRTRPGRNGKEDTGLYVPIYKDTTTKVIPDSILVKLDSIRVADSLHRADSAALMEESTLEAPAFSTAKDSLIESFVDGKQMLYYYGDVSVTYGDMKLSAAYMEYDVDAQTVYARGVEDPVTGELTGNPVMEDGKGKYEMKELRYNFKSKKAAIKNMVTNDEQGILRGNNIKMMPDQSINLTQGRYTVCDCEEPHYYLKLTAAKVMTKPSRNTVFGPAWPVVEDVPMFPIVLPFGFIPKRPERATGLLMPSIGEEQARGFFIKDMGMYFVFGDYIDLSLTGTYFTLGSWSVDLNSRYKVNYKFNGNLSVTYSYDQIGQKGEPDFSSTTNFGVKWSHQQDSKAHPGSTFSASVNFSSPSNSRYNSRSVTEALNNQTSSSISYTHNWNGKFNLSVNALHSQNTRDSSYAFTLPNITFSVSKFYPFKRKNRVGKEKFYEKFSLSYNTAFQNKVNFKASEFGKPGFTEKFQNGMQHSFSIGLPNFTLFKYLNVNPSVSYGMNWFFDSTEKFYNPETDKVEDRKGGLFSTFGATHNYSGSLSMDTQIYGLFNFGKHHKLQAIRHIIKPSVSFNLSPDKGTYFNGYRTLEYTDIRGDVKTLDYNIYSGQMYSPPGRGSAATANLVIGNNLEAKVRDLKDTTGTGSKKIKLLDQFNINTGYDFLRDSLKMNNVGITISTNIFEKLGISGNLNFDPYAVDGKGKKINKFNVAQTGHLLRLTNANLSMSYSFSGKGTINGNDGSKGGSASSDKGSSSMPAYTRIFYHPVTGEYIPGGWVYYMNPNSPWSVNLSYSLSYSKNYKYEKDHLKTVHNINQTLNVSGQFKITNALSINATTGFDIQALKLTTTQISATYDLHCFNISFSWVPTGKWKSWNFLISANAAALSDLLRFRKSNSFWDN